MNNLYSNTFNTFELKKTKRKQVKIACVNCQSSCKKCDECRPCKRCITRGIEDTCVDSVHKVRDKGIKRGPYKKSKSRKIDNQPYQVKVYEDNNNNTNQIRLPPISNLLSSIPNEVLEVKGSNPNFSFASSTAQSYKLSNYSYSSKSEDKPCSIKSLLNEADLECKRYHSPLPICSETSISYTKYIESEDKSKSSSLSSLFYSSGLKMFPNDINSPSTFKHILYSSSFKKE